MLLSNYWHRMFIESDGEQFEVKAICRTKEEANAFMTENPQTSVIDEDKHGNIFVVNILPTK